MRTTRVVSVTLPPALFEQAQALAKAENRTMSELVREALRRYQFSQFMEEMRAVASRSEAWSQLKTEEDVVELVRQVRREIAAEEAVESLTANVA